MMINSKAVDITLQYVMGGRGRYLWYVMDGRGRYLQYMIDGRGIHHYMSPVCDG